MFGLLENNSIRFLRLGGNPAVRLDEKELIDRRLQSNRKLFYAPRWLRSSTGFMNMAGGSSESIPVVDFSEERPAMEGGGGRGGGGYELSSSPGSPLERSPTRRAWTLDSGSLRKVCSCSAADGAGPMVNVIAGEEVHHESCPLFLLPQPAVASGGAVQSSDSFIQTVEHHRAVSAPVSWGPPAPAAALKFSVSGGATTSPSRGAPSPSVLLDNMLEEEAGGGKSDVLSVLFSAPLAWRDWNNQLHPIEMLEFDLERELLVQSFQEAGCDVRLRMDFATTERLRTAVTLGCRALHYSGHGHKERLTFEGEATRPHHSQS